MTRIVSYGEVMMRLNPTLYYRLDQTNHLEMHFTGTGLNVLTGLAMNAIETRLITALPDNRVGDVAKQWIQTKGIDASYVSKQGNHIGIYVLELGHQYRPSQVTYLNRSESAFNQCLLSEEAIEKALESVTHLHVCGIALSTSEVSRKNVLNLTRYAARHDIAVIFDFNYRPSLNQDIDEKGLLEAYEAVLKTANLVVGSYRDVKRLIDETDQTKAMQTFMKTYEIDTFIGTHKSESENVKQIQGFAYHDGGLALSTIYPIETLDRIGTGDAFVSGFLTGILKKTSVQEALEFATCAAHLAYTTMGDSPVLDEAFVKHYMKHKPEVIR